MKIKDQIRARREQLGVSISELARRIGVSTQSIRYWEAGRSFPGKNKAPDVEAALSFVLDWTEGKKTASVRPQMAALVTQEDIDLLLLLGRLPASFKELLAGIATAHLEAITGERKAFSGRVTETPVPSFKQKEKGSQIVETTSPKKRGRPRKNAA